MGFGTDIKRLRQEALFSVQRIADLVGIDAARWRKWEEKDYMPRRDDVVRLEKFFGMDLETLAKQESIKNFLKVPNEDDASQPSGRHGTAVANLVSNGADYQEKYIQELNEKAQILKDQVSFLQDLVKTNLVGISNQQQIVQAEIQAVHQWDAQIAAKGDKEKEAIALRHIHQLSAGNLKKLRKKGTHAGVDK